jgi:hypothetical protein
MGLVLRAIDRTVAWAEAAADRAELVSTYLAGLGEIGPRSSWEILGPKRWLRAWYRAVVETVPAARSSHDQPAKLVIVDSPHVIDEDDGGMCVGVYYQLQHKIVIGTSAPHVMLATLLHEIAHVVANPRHHRHHGYSWRRAMTALMVSTLGVPPETSERWRMTHGSKITPRPSRRECLDVVAELAAVAAEIRVHQDGSLRLTTPTMNVCQKRWPK